VVVYCILARTVFVVWQFWRWCRRVELHLIHWTDQMEAKLDSRSGRL